MGLKEGSCDSVNWIHLAQDGINLQIVVNIVLNFWVL